MDNTSKMATLLTTLRRQTNGAVVGAMGSRGVDYPLSYGVSVAAIRSASAHYAPDHGFAQLLYRQNVRELRIVATYIADPALTEVEEARFWGAGITSGEIAEHVALMLGRSPNAESIVVHWLSQDSTLLRYAALMCGARAAGKASGWDFARILPLIHDLCEIQDGMLDRGVVAFISRQLRYNKLQNSEFEVFLEKLHNSRNGLWQEILALIIIP